MTKKKFNKLLHKWLSIPLGIIVVILCLTGAALVFQQEMLELSNPTHYTIETIEGEPIPLDKLVPMVNEKLGNNSVASVKVSDDPNRTYTMRLAEGFRISVFVNQYTGEITGRYAVKESGFFTIMSLHRWLLDSTHTWGKYITGWTTVLFIVIIITGLCYISKKRKENYKLCVSKGTGRLVYSLHNTLGTYAALILIVCSLSGLMWSFDWFRDGTFALFGAEKEPERTQAPRGNSPKEKPVVNTSTWQVALDNVLKPNSGYDAVTVSDGAIDAHPSNTYRTRVQDKFVFDKTNGAITKFTPFAEQGVRPKVWAWAYSLHVGDYWGICSKIFTFICCLIGASLPLTGYYFTWKKWRSKKKRLQKTKLANT